MNKKKAYEILGFSSPYKKITIEMIKKQYRLKALQYHPDKNKSKDAAAFFQEVNNAYELLIKKHDFIEEWEEPFDCDRKYNVFLFSFLQELFENEKGELLMIIFKRISTVCEQKAWEVLERLDKKTLSKIFEIMKMYKDVLHFTIEILKKIEDKLNAKINENENIILNPLWKDLFENRLYKLTVNGFHYVIPLWHHELIYDNSGCEIIVHCLPILNENIEIDENNDIHISVSYKLIELWETDLVNISIGEKCLPINTRLLKLTKNQTVLFSNQGISRINTTDIYDISKKGEIYVHIEIEF